MANKNNNKDKKFSKNENFNKDDNMQKSNFSGKQGKSKTRNDLIADSDMKKKRVPGVGTHTHNDPAWYAKSPELLSAAAAVNWFPGAGHKLNLGLDEVDDAQWRASVPGVAMIEYQPTLGKSVSETSAVNIAARSFFGDMRAFQSGRSNYDPTDLMFYVLAAANAYAYLAWMIRVYGTIRYYSTTNKYLPTALLRALGCDDVALRGKGFDLYWYIQEYRTKLSSFCFPSNMPIYDRYQFLNEAYYMDSECVEAKIYVMRPRGFYKYEEMEAPHGKLKFEVLNPHTLDDIIEFGNRLVGALSDSEDCYIMSGDILRAYQDDVFAVPTIPLDYLAPIKYDLMMLEQIHHATVWPIYDNAPSDNWDITQDLDNFNSPTIICNPMLTANELRPCNPILAKANRLLSAPELPPKPEMVIEMTRLMSFTQGEDAVFADHRGAGWIQWRLSSFGTEIVTNFKVFQFIQDRNSGDWKLRELPFTNISFAAEVLYDSGDGMTINNLIAQQGQIELSMAFKKHPLMGSVVIDISGDEPTTISHYLWDTDNYTVVTESQIDKMHETALLSLLDVPTMGLGKFPKKPNS